MIRRIPEIEDTLQLCKDMEKNFAVIPLIDVEKHFPAPRLPAYPNIPTYDLEKLTEWATGKGWSVIPEDTWSKNGHKIPGIKFTRLGKVAVPNTTPEPPTDKTDDKHDTNKVSAQKILEGVIVLIVGAAILYLIKTHFGITL